MKFFVHRNNFNFVKQSANKAYAHANTFQLIHNLKKWRNCRHWMRYHYKAIHDKMEIVSKRCSYLGYIQMEALKTLIPKIIIDKSTMDNFIHQLLKKDDIRFKCSTGTWSKKEDEQLLYYLKRQKIKNYILTEKEINYLHKNEFHQRFYKKTIIHKCFQFGWRYDKSF